MCTPVFVSWHCSEMFAVPSKYRYWYYVFVPTFRQNREVSRILCVPSPSMISYCFSAFSDSAQQFGYQQLRTAMTKFGIVSFVYFIHAAEYGAVDLFLRARLRALTENGSLRANEGLLAPLPDKMSRIFLTRKLLRSISNFTVSPVAAILAFARFFETDWKASY